MTTDRDGIAPSPAHKSGHSFTPGPWRYGVRFDGSIWLSLGDHKTGPHFQADLCASEADARLIAAAPDLLEALDALARMCVGTTVEEDNEYARALAIIRRARGE
jgi:hypothetical protein